MLPTGIDLERPSAEYHKEDNRPNVNINMMDGCDGRLDRGRASVSVNYIKTAGPDKENGGLSVGAAVLNAGHTTYAADEINLNSVKNLEPHDGMEFESKEKAF
ncbi:hypothetical protein REPUB_Repub04eG0004700 [Reevesia pubescens]